MTVAEPESRHQNERSYDVGGLRFNVYFTRGHGPTARLFGKVDGVWTQLVRFDEFYDNPHYHVPASGPQIEYDRSFGEPLVWFVDQVRSHLPETLTRAGFANVLAEIDVETISESADRMGQEMIDCMPEGFRRVPGVGIEKVEV